MIITLNASTSPFPMLLTLKPLKRTGGESVGRYVGLPVLRHTALSLHSGDEKPVDNKEDDNCGEINASNMKDTVK